MQIGFVGLGRMGGNMVHRIKRDSDHEVVAFDFCRGGGQAAAEGVGRRRSLARGPRRASSRRRAPSGSWCRPATRRRRRSTSSPSCSSAATSIVDGGNSRWHRRQAPRRGAERQGASTTSTSASSGGVWGLEVGYCMMVGGTDDGGRAPGARSSTCSRRRDGWRHFGGPGAGHFVKMVHNGVEYGMMQAYAEGFELLAQVRVRASTTRRSRSSGGRARSCARGCASWLRAPSRPRATTSQGLRGLRRRLGRGSLDDRRRRSTTTCRRRSSRASLFARFCSRGNGDYTDRVLAALRNQFGGHAGGAEARRHASASRRAGASSEPPAGQPAHRGPGAAARSRRRRWSSSAPPGTWPRASCCRRSTTSPTRARCPSASA